MAKKKAAEKAPDNKPTVVPDPLPKGISQEMYDEVKNTIVSGFAANQTPDAIKSAIFSSGVPFSKLNRLYSLITKAEGLVVDPKVISAGIEAALGDTSFTFDESYGDLASLSEDIAGAVNGATPAKVMSAVKAHYKEHEAEFPRKPAPSRGRMGIINKTLINVFKENKEATQADCYDALVPKVKTLKNADDYSKTYHKMLYAIANGLSANEVLTRFSADAE